MAHNFSEENTLDLAKLKPNSKTKENLFIGNNYIFLEKEMQIEQIDVDILKKWKIDNIYTKDYFQSEKKFGLYFKDQLRDFRNFTTTYLNDVKEFYETIRLKYQGTMPNFDHHFTTLMHLYENPANFLAFYLNTEIKSEKYEEVALLTAFHAVTIGMRLKLSKKQLRDFFYAAIFADIGFQHKSEKSLLYDSSKKDGTTRNFPQEHHNYLDYHIKLGCSILKEEFKVPAEIIYLVLTQHTYLDNSGSITFPAEKLSLAARIFTLAHEYVYLTSNFLKPFRPPLLPTNAVIFLLKHKERYDIDVLNVFLTVNSFFPPGEVVLLDNKKPAVCIKASYRYPKRPLVEVITQMRRMAHSKTETINLVEENTNIVALIGSEKNRQRCIRAIYSKF